MNGEQNGRQFSGTQAVYALTPAAAGLALSYLARCEPARAFMLEAVRQELEIAPQLASRVEFIARGGFAKVVENNWKRFDAHLFIMATGIVVRRIAALLEHKTKDPAVVVCDEKGEFAISLLSGHIGGANRLARQAAAIFGGRAVITTATDVQGLAAVDEVAAGNGFRIVNPEAIKTINSLILARRPVALAGPAIWTGLLADELGERVMILSEKPGTDLPENPAGLVLVDRPAAEFDSVFDEIAVLGLESPRLVAGIGCRRGVSAAEIEAALASVLADHGLSRSKIAALASIDLKKDEVGLLEFARGNAWPLCFFTAAQLKDVAVPTPSVRVAKATGSPSVSEASAIRAGGGRLVVPKTRFARVTVALAVQLKRNF